MRRPQVKWFLPLYVAANGLLAQPAFLRKDIPVSGYAFAGDFNGDRRPDLAVCSSDATATIRDALRSDIGRHGARHRP